MAKQTPVGIPTLKVNADVVRKVAADLGLKYEEQAVQGKNDAIRFYFGLLDPEVARMLTSALPYYLYFQAISEAEFLRRTGA